MPLYLAFEGEAPAAAKRFTEIATGTGCGLKIGIAAFGALGAEAVAALRAPLFLDLKFHDIPSVVALAVARTTAICRPQLMTLHAAGGRKMMEHALAAAAEAAKSVNASRPRLLAVTILTSLAADEELSQMLARQAREAGMDGIVCSALEAAGLRRIIGEEMLIVAPGIRAKGDDNGEQKRVATPELAARNGVDSLVVGRPITASADPAAAAESIVREFLGAK